ncbi:MAG: YceI family protein [Sporichthyaceae bacterium]
MSATTTLRSGTWTVTTERATASFAVRSIMHGQVHGTVPVTSGTVLVDTSGQPIGVQAELDLSSIKTDNPRRDKDLRKPRLLDLDTYPTMTFSSEIITATDTGWDVEGTLQVRGRSVPLTFAVVCEPASADGQVRCVATATLDRRGIGFKAPRPLIGHELMFEVDALLVPRA